MWLTLVRSSVLYPLRYLQAEALVSFVRGHLKVSNVSRNQDAKPLKTSRTSIFKYNEY